MVTRWDQDYQPGLDHRVQELQEKLMWEYLAGPQLRQRDAGWSSSGDPGLNLIRPGEFALARLAAKAS